MKLVPVAALLGVACAQDNEAAKAYVRNYWRDSFVAGDKALFATRGVGEDMGNDKIKAMCFAKGGTNTVLEPLMLADIHSSLIRIQSRAACTVAGSDNILGVAQSSRRRLADAGSGDASSGESDTDACGLPPLTCCPTRDGGEGPARADGIPICPPAPPLARTDSWFGEYHADVYGSFTFKVSMVNGQELSEGLTDARTWSIEELKGVGASIIAPDGYDSGDAANPKGVRYDAVHYGEGHRPWAMYDGGMVVTAKVGDWFTYRMFMFKNEETLEAARAVPENLGLQYATTFPGDRSANLGEAHPDSLASMNSLGLLLQARGRYSEAEPVFRQVSRQASKSKSLGSDHPQTLAAKNRLGEVRAARRNSSQGNRWIQDLSGGLMRFVRHVAGGVAFRMNTSTLAHRHAHLERGGATPKPTNKEDVPVMV